MVLIDPNGCLMAHQHKSAHVESSHTAFTFIPVRGLYHLEILDVSKHGKSSQFNVHYTMYIYIHYAFSIMNSSFLQVPACYDLVLV